MPSSPVAWLDVSMEDLFRGSSSDSNDEMLVLNDLVPSEAGGRSSAEGTSSNRQRPDTPMPSFSPSVDDSAAANNDIGVDRLVLLTSDESDDSDVDFMYLRPSHEIGMSQFWQTPEEAFTPATFAAQSSPEPGPSHRRSTRSSTNRPVSREQQPPRRRHGNTRRTEKDDHGRTSASSKRKRRSSAAERSTQLSRHRKRNTRLADAVDSDSDVEVLSSLQRNSDNAVGETTLANIRQMECDELLARHLQSVYDNDRTGSGRSSSSHGAASRRSNNQRRHRRPPPPRPVTILDRLNLNTSSPFPSQDYPVQQRRSDRNTPVASRTRSARQNYANLLDTFFLSDDDLEPIEELFTNPRSFGSGRIRSTNPNTSRGLRAAHFESADTFLDAFFAEDDRPAVASNNHPNREIYRYRFGQLLRHHHPGLFGDDAHHEIIELDFENILNIADRVGDASTGLKAVEIAAFTTQKSYTTTTGHDANDTCTICMTNFSQGENLTILPCMHDFHEPCVGRWLQTKPTCPICRVDVRA